jgi:hypothetical protein
MMRKKSPSPLNMTEEEFLSKVRDIINDEDVEVSFQLQQHCYLIQQDFYLMIFKTFPRDMPNINIDNRFIKIAGQKISDLNDFASILKKPVSFWYSFNYNNFELILKDIEPVLRELTIWEPGEKEMLPKFIQLYKFRLENKNKFMNTKEETKLPSFLSIVWKTLRGKL